MVEVAEKKVDEKAPLKLNLACGQIKMDGFTGVDIAGTKEADVVHDLFTFPWPFENESVDEVHCSHFFEHIPGLLRGKWMDELYRVMKPGAKAQIITPYWSSIRAIQDFTHAWPPVCEASFLYFNKKWREDNKLDHYGVSCDFDFTYGYNLSPDLNVKSDDYKYFAVKNYVNSISDVFVNLTKREMGVGR